MDLPLGSSLDNVGIGILAAQRDLQAAIERRTMRLR